MPIFAVIDTNVIVSALLSTKDDSATVQVIEKVFRKEIIPIYSDIIFREYINVLNRPKFHFSKNLIDYILLAIENFGTLKDVEENDSIVLLDMKDVPFYRLFAEKDGAYLITGNIKHFPQDPRILTARQFIDNLKSK